MDFYAGAMWGRASGAQADTSGAGARADRAGRRVEELEARLDRALMTMEAMWTLLRNKLDVTDEQLGEAIVEVDLSDGVLDGKARRPAVECSHCNRKIPRRFPRCLYCGGPVEHDPFA
ncbi:MAG: hypothetical protein ACYTGN_13445 [Planctomycetota bacterium]|jgi:hypothetical protein